MTENGLNPNDVLNTNVTASAPDLGIDPDKCIMPRGAEPCMIIILGATGDLTARKLIPALFNLFLNDGLPVPFSIVGCGRTRLEDESFRAKMGDALQKAGAADRQKQSEFIAALHYRVIDYKELESFKSLSASLEDLDNRFQTRGNKIFYVALPPNLYQPVATFIGQAGLSAEKAGGNGWSRIVIEKPFGTDLGTAKELDKSIQAHFREHQIFRIDHYLAKETVQDVLMFRFANSLFEPIWNRRYVDHVAITATETLGVEHRAGYYEQAGVLRDMFQNHMMQLLALTAMEPPSRFEADLVRDEKIKVFRALRPFSLEHMADHLLLGQYQAGAINGQPVAAYRQEPGVSPKSLTPTYAMLKIYIDNWRWQGVPFYLTSGKRLADKITEIVIQFKPVPHSMFRQTLGESIAANRLTMGIYPEERITLKFQTKNPGARVCLRTVTMDFYYRQNYSGPTLDAYETVLIDCMLGDQMLFWRQDGVERSWAFLSPILDACSTCENPQNLLHFYDAGSGAAEIHKAFLQGRNQGTG
jgi:glucose-6-phosphate 1-dehydrogenase